jgi:predicted dehydrogenase
MGVFPIQGYPILQHRDRRKARRLLRDGFPPERSTRVEVKEKRDTILPNTLALCTGESVAGIGFLGKRCHPSEARNATHTWEPRESMGFRSPATAGRWRVHWSFDGGNEGTKGEPTMHWGILSTGNIAQTFAKAVLENGKDRLAAVGSRSLENAKAFAATYGCVSAYGSYDELLKDREVEAVYIATPHPQHAEWVVKAAEAGKHILCEKPLGMDPSEVHKMVEAAQKNGVVLMEAFMYRCHPQTRRLVQLIREGAIGKVKVIRAAFCFDRDLGLQHRLFNKALGGGGILDLGCYPVSFSRLVAGAAMGKPFAEPEEVLATACLGAESGVDEYASAVLRFPGGVLAEIACGTRVEREGWSVLVYGSEGRIEVPSPWHCGFTAGESRLIRFAKGSQEAESIPVPTAQGVYALEVEAFSGFVRKGHVESPAMTSEDSLGNSKVLETWLKTAR